MIAESADWLYVSIVVSRLRGVAKVSLSSAVGGIHCSSIILLQKQKYHTKQVKARVCARSVVRVWPREYFWNVF